jgi:MFS family permease
MPRSLVVALACGAAILGVSVGLRQGLGLFLEPISLDLGLGREAFAFAIGLMNLVWGLLAPFAGALADRHGAARVIALGAVAYAAGLLVMALGGAGGGTDGGGGGQLVLGGALIGLGLSGSGFTVVLGAVGRAAPPERRGQALGLTSVGGSIGQFLALPYCHLLIEGFGWLPSLTVLAGTALCMAALARGLARGRPIAAPAPGSLRAESLAGALRLAGAQRGFWLLTAGFFVCGFHLAFVAVHLPAYLTDQGMPAWLPAAALTLVGLCNIVGTLLCGWLGDRHRKSGVLSLLYLARALIFLIFLLFPVSETSVLVFAATMGFLWLGTVPLTSGVVAAIFGPVHLSMLFGIVFLSHQLGGFLGAWIAGALYDALGSYDVMWWASVALGLLSAALHWPIDERPLARPAVAASVA